MSAESALLDPLETKPHAAPGILLTGNYTPRTEFRSEPATELELKFRHSGWAVRREKTWRALLRCNVSDARLDRFANCGGGLWLKLDPAAQDLRLVCNTCKDRWCVACQTQRAGKICAVLQERMASTRCRFVTLTRRHSHAPLADQVDALYDAFRRLRRREFWRSHVSGGAAFLEIKIGEGSGLWHCHLHIICEGSYLDQRELSREWLAVTQDSSIVDVRAIARHEDRARYVTKYVTKPASPEVYNSPERFDEMICALRGRRLCTTFDGWRGVKLNPEADDTPDLEPLGSVDFLAREARRGDERARHWLSIAAHKWPHLAPLFAVTLGAGP